MSNKKHEQNIPSLPLATKLGASDAARHARRTHDHITVLLQSLLLFVRLPDSSSATIILHLGNTSLLAFFPITNDASNTGKLSDKKGLSPIERSTIHTLSSLITFSMPLDAQQHFSGGTKRMFQASFFVRLTRCQAIQRLQKP
ncbi:unnamed protein product [Sphagnum troendelagicum]|uniref:Uncharacterized protein n=1 Tax=Sphagnum troendelagicum TaxID=128251 RepID=A0ABP0TZ11_9BRYO